MVKCGQVLTDGLAGDEFPELFPALRRAEAWRSHARNLPTERRFSH